MNTKLFFPLALMLSILLAGCTEVQPLQQPTTTNIAEEPLSTSSPNTGVDIPVTDKILFLSDQNGGTSVFIMDPDGQNIQEIQISGLPNNVIVDRPVWSNSMQKFFMGVSDGSDGEIYSFNFDGSELTNITNSPDNYESNPVPHPSNSRVLYIVVDLDLDIGIMNADGTNPVNLTFHPARDTKPNWLGNSSTIIFSSNRHGTPNIYTMDEDGTNITNISQGRGQDHLESASPDGTQIYFDSDRDGMKDIFVINVSTNEITNLTNSADIRETTPILSPDGKRVAFYLQTEKSSDIYVVNRDGTGLQQITNTPDQYELGVTWSLDNQKLLYTSEVNGQYEIFSIDIESLEITRITNTEADEYAPLWVNFSQR